MYQFQPVIPDAEPPAVPKLKLPEAESEGIYEEYDGQYEEYRERYAEYVNEGKAKVLKDVNIDPNGAGEKNGDGDKNGDEDKNEQGEEIYEQYDGDYEKYISQNDKSSNRINPHGIILQKLVKKKCWILLGIILLSIVGIVVGLSVYFTAKSSPATKLVSLSNATISSSTWMATMTEGIET